jgi:hypothetical protein
LAFRTIFVRALVLSLSLAGGALLGWMYSLAAAPFTYSALLFMPAGALFALIIASSSLGLGKRTPFRLPVSLRWILGASIVFTIVVFAGGAIEQLGKPPPRWQLPASDERVIGVPTDGHFLATCEERNERQPHQFVGPIRIRDAATSQVQAAFLPGERLYDLLLSPDGQRLALMCDNGMLKLFNLQTGEVESKMRFFDIEDGKREVVTQGSGWAFSEDGGMLAFADEQTKQIVLWNAELQRFTVLCNQDIRRIQAFSPDGKQLVLSSWLSNGFQIEFWDTTTNKVDHAFELEKRVSRMMFSPNGDTLLAQGGQKAPADEVWFMDPTTGSKGMELGTFADFGFSPDGKTILAVSTSLSREISLIDTASGKRLLEMKLPFFLRPTLVPGTPAIVTHENNTIALWDIPPHRPLWWIVGLIGYPLIFISMILTGAWDPLRKPRIDSPKPVQ